MSTITICALSCCGLFVAMVLLTHLGSRLARGRAAGAEKGTGAIDGMVFALLGLMLAFTFSSSSQRLEHRRELVTEEANAISTAWSRLDLLPLQPQTDLRALLRSYLDGRIETFRLVPMGLDAVLEKHAATMALQPEIWGRVMPHADDPRVVVGLLPALNECFDLASSHTAAVRTHSSVYIFGVLFFLALCAALDAGLSMGPVPSRLHAYGLALIVSVTTYVILDMEFPRVGLIRVDASDQALLDVRASMD